MQYGGISVTSKILIKPAGCCCGAAEYEENEDNITQDHFGTVSSITRKTVKNKTYVMFKDSKMKEYMCEIPKDQASVLQQALVDAFENVQVSFEFYCCDFENSALARNDFAQAI